MNLREQIVSAVDRPVKSIEVPEWGGTVYLRQMTVGERQKVFDRIEEKPDKDKSVWGVWLLLAALGDKDGNRLFTDEDYGLLDAKNPKVIDRVGHVAAVHNGLLASSVDDAKKNSEVPAN